jgi:hypothetical protein
MDKKVEIECLDRLAFGLKDGKCYKELREDLDAFLINQYKGSESRRKYIDVHMKIWVSIPEEHMQLRNRALDLLTCVTTKERLVLHWGLCLLAFNIFRDVSAIVGKLFSINDKISLALVHNRIIESWGDRTTLIYAVQRILKSMSIWGALQDSSKQGIYELVDKIVINEKHLKLWLLECYLSCIDQKTVTVESLNQANSLFPFEINVKLSDLMDSNIFEVNRQGLDVDVVELR